MGGRPNKSEKTASIVTRFQIDFAARQVDLLCVASFLERVRNKTSRLLECGLRIHRKHAGSLLVAFSLELHLQCTASLPSWHQ